MNYQLPHPYATLRVCDLHTLASKQSHQVEGALEGRTAHSGPSQKIASIQKHLSSSRSEERGQAPQAFSVHTNQRVSGALLEETQTTPAPWAQVDCLKPLGESQRVKQMQKTVLFQILPSLPPLKSVFAELGVWLPVC